MNNDNANRESLLREHPREIVHLRTQILQRRFTLVLGAGVSCSIGFPSWPLLTTRIEEAIIAQGGTPIHAGIATKVQSLFLQFRKHKVEQPSSSGNGRNVYNKACLENFSLSEWRSLVRSELYRDVPQDRKSIMEKHPYLEHLLRLVQATSFVVNYNFDDTLQTLLDLTQPEASHLTAWLPHQQFMPGSTVIYHPNGYLPFDPHDRQSNWLVFSEEEFSDQLVDNFNGVSSTLLHYFTRNTCLLLGLSLNDQNLKMLLRQCAMLHPGNIHYYIRFVPKGENLSDKERRAIADLYFETYNLVTLFFDEDQIGAFIRLLTTIQNKFDLEAANLGVISKYVFYLTGTVGTGKTTCTEHLSNFTTHTEWVEKRGKELSKSFSSLNPNEEIEVDKWIDRQFFQKNHTLLNAKDGIHLVDRCPLDPLSYKDNFGRRNRASQIIERVRRDRNLIAGVIIHLLGDEEELLVRLMSRSKKNWTTRDVRTLQERTTQIYSGLPVIEIPTSGRSVSAIVRDVVRAIVTCNYRKCLCDIDNRLNEIANGKWT